jgi:protein-L-isoaspartate O-methyltransferase
VKAISWYDKNAAEVAGSYEMAETEKVHEWFFEYLPKRSLVVLDVGAGSGRDAAYFSSMGHDVIWIC